MGTILRIWRFGMIVFTVAAAINRFAGRKKVLRPRNYRTVAPAKQPLDTGGAASDAVQRGESPVR